MGKTTKPLTIYCHPDIAEWPEIQKLSDQGHTVLVLPDLPMDYGVTERDLDLILHPKAWHMTPQHRKYLPLAIAAARKKRYSKGK